ncbi:hypothetical protein [Cupriavidus sp. IK-TO18]|uniref:hypothetical protein n=1 Tax=Cupriavidus sp. IK-TO18 TaxID=2782182 RepID=UPI0021047466|nr:hypothetical protein [Cupriavidus sp. IK-TO18]
MAKKKPGSQRPSKYDSPYSPRPSRSAKVSWQAQAYNTQPKKSPTLWIIGACAVVAGAAALGSCSDDADDDPGVTVRRASYATLQDCEADWNTPNDCESVPADDTRNLYSSSLADAASSPGANGSSGSGHGSTAYYARWYGPYYTASGTVYHPDGSQTQRDMSSGPLRPMTAYDSNGMRTQQQWAPSTPNAAMWKKPPCAAVRSAAGNPWGCPCAPQPCRARRWCRGVALPAGLAAPGGLVAVECCFAFAVSYFLP